MLLLVSNIIFYDSKILFDSFFIFFIKIININFDLYIVLYCIHHLLILLSIFNFILNLFLNFQFLYSLFWLIFIFLYYFIFFRYPWKEIKNFIVVFILLKDSSIFFISFFIFLNPLSLAFFIYTSRFIGTEIIIIFFIKIFIKNSKKNFSILLFLIIYTQIFYFYRYSS